jgi:Putative Flp pilus-assembly TadE/G-like
MAGVRCKAGGEGGKASLLMLGTYTLLFGLAVVLFAFGQALGSEGRHQRAADLAAISAGQVMQELYPRLFEPPVLANGLPNPRHLPLPVYLALARRAALRGRTATGWQLARRM